MLQEAYVSGLIDLLEKYPVKRKVYLTLQKIYSGSGAESAKVNRRIKKRLQMYGVRRHLLRLESVSYRESVEKSGSPLFRPCLC